MTRLACAQMEVADFLIGFDSLSRSLYPTHFYEGML